MREIVSTKEIEENDWVQQWAGNWCPLSCSYFGHQYTETLKQYYGKSLEHAVFISRDERRNANFPKKELEEFGNYLAAKARRDKRFALGLAADLRKKTDAILGVVKKLVGKDFSWGEYEKFLSAYYEYVNPHVGVKRIVDFLPKQLLDELLPVLSGARVYAEPVYKETEDFTIVLCESIGRKTGYPANILRCLMKEELENYFKTGALPARRELEKRFQACALVFNQGKYQLFTGTKVDGIENALRKHGEEGVVNGRPAYAGKASGRVRIVFDPSKAGNFREGEVLVTGMTRPEFLPLVKKAAAVVTDAGGMLSHAAIVARELKKVTVIGTEKATKVFKDGDLVEVDAEKGVVRKLR